MIVKTTTTTNKIVCNEKLTKRCRQWNWIKGTRQFSDCSVLLLLPSFSVVNKFPYKFSMPLLCHLNEIFLSLTHSALIASKKMENGIHCQAFSDYFSICWWFIDFLSVDEQSTSGCKAEIEVVADVWFPLNHTHKKSQLSDSHVCDFICKILLCERERIEWNVRVVRG